MSLRLKEKNQVLFSFENLMHDDSLFVDELVLLTSKVRREVCGVLNSFLLFLIKYENKKTHNMVFLTLDIRFKSFQIIFSFVGREQGVVIVEEYDWNILYPMLVKCHEHLHPLIMSYRNYVDYDIFY
jgi:hypothetical protein